MHETASDPLTALSQEGRDKASRSDLGATSKSEMQVDSQADTHGSLRVLIVQDNAVNRKILATMLKRVGCRYAEAVDGADAVLVFTSFSPDLVLLDINMPVKDGFQAATEMRQIETSQGRNRSRIVAVTAMCSEGQRRKALVECGIDEWKTKPVGIKQLRQEVEKMRVDER